MPIKAIPVFKLSINGITYKENPFVDLMPRINGFYMACNKSMGKEIDSSIVRLWLMQKSRLYVEPRNALMTKVFNGDDIRCSNVKIEFFIDSIKQYKSATSIPDIPRIFEYDTISYSQFVNSGYWQLARHSRFMKDDYECKRCKAKLKSSFLNAHHKNYDSRGYEIENNQKDLITLCVSCHQTIHRNSNANVNAKYFK